MLMSSDGYLEIFSKFMDTTPSFIPKVVSANLFTCFYSSVPYTLLLYFFLSFF